MKIITISLIVIIALFIITGFFTIFSENIFPPSTNKIKPLKILKIIIENIYIVLHILVLRIIFPIAFISTISYVAYRIIYLILIS